MPTSRFLAPEWFRSAFHARSILWKPPYIADITRFLKPGDNLLKVEVVNQWVNCLVGDLKLPKAGRKTYTSVLDGPPPSRSDPRSAHRLADPDADKYLRASGLIGPVEIRYSKTHRLAP